MHPCNPASRKRNLVKLIENQNQNDKEAILGTSLLNFAKAKKTTGQNLELAGVGGNCKKINLALRKDIKDKHLEIKVDIFKHVEKEMDMSRAATLKLRNILKRDVPVESGARRMLREWDHVMDNQLVLYKVDNFELTVSATRAKTDKNGKVLEPGVPTHSRNISKDVVFIWDVGEHFHWILEQHGIDAKIAKFKIYIDSGDGSTKILASVIDENCDPDITFTSLEQPNSRLTGVNRVLLLAYVEGIQESYTNI